MQEKLQQLEDRITMLEQSKSLPNFDTVDTYLSIRNLTEFIEVVSVVPTNTPRNFYEQIKIYISGATYRLYVYNYSNNVWRYVTLT